jgi:hypothetical protein
VFITGFIFELSALLDISCGFAEWAVGTEEAWVGVGLMIAGLLIRAF